MKLINFSVNRPVTILMIIFIILILGFVSFTNLAIDLFPEFNLPYMMVLTNYEGAGPEEIENLVTRPLEETLATISGVDEIFSESISGSSMIFIAMNWGTDMDFAGLEIREKLDLITAFMPSEVEKPMIFKMDPSMMPILEIGVSGEEDLAYLKDLVDNKIVDRLLRIEGVASVNTTGGLIREIQVLIDPNRLNAYGLSIDQITATLSTENINFSTGQVIDGNKEYLVRTIGQYDDVEDIKKVVIPLPRGGQIFLSELGEVKDTHKEVSQLTRLNGEPSIGIHVVKQSKTNTVQVANKVKKELSLLEKELPGNIKINYGFDQSRYISMAINDLVRNIIIGGCLAVVILLLFLRNIRSTLVIAFAIPICIISTFILIYFNKLTLNMMTLGGMALGVGMMVDCSIVVLENIYRHGQEGYSKIEAAKKGASEVSSAITASTLTTLAVFLPIVFLEGIASELFKELALTISFALAMSLLVALTLIPMFASKLLVINGNGDNSNKSRKNTPIKWASKKMGDFLDWLNKIYGNVLSWALGHRKTVIVFVTIALIGSFALVPMIGMSFIPSMDSGEIYINLKLSRGTQLEETNKTTIEVEDFLSSIPEVKTIFTTVAPPRDGLFGSGAAEQANLRVMLVDKKQRNRSSAKVAEDIRSYLATIPGVEYGVTASDASLHDTGMSPIQVKVKGSNLETLERLSEEIKSVIETIPGTREVETTAVEGNPEYRIYVNRDRAAQYGLSVAQIAGNARTILDGQVATRLRTGDTEIDVKVMYPEEYRNNLKSLEDSYITSPTGVRVPLSMVAEIKMDTGPIRITRENQIRTYTVNAQLLDRDLGSVMNEIQEKIDSEIQVPRGYTIEYGGEMEEMTDAFSSLFLALILAIILVYMVMASQFESLMHPFVIMFAMPTTLIGVILGLALTGKEFSVPTFIGVIMLAGIVVNNAIVLVDYINILRRRGLDKTEAILKAGPIRLRPILMTTLTTVLALIPTAIGMGEGAETSAPMAIAVIAGLTVSTVFTLVLIPVIYTLFDDLGEFIRRVIGWQKTEIKTTNQGEVQ
jgi:HAE1 family hydrophobic/amphiphilic exporter-1